MNVDNPVRVLIADDHAMVREGLSVLLTRRNINVAAEACNGQEAIDLYRTHRPDVTLMDLRMPIVDGLAATRAIVNEFPHARIIVLTNGADEEQSSLRAGAKALVQKDAPSQELIRTILAVHQTNDFSVCV